MLVGGRGGNERKESSAQRYRPTFQLWQEEEMCRESAINRRALIISVKIGHVWSQRFLISVDKPAIALCSEVFHN